MPVDAHEKVGEETLVETQLPALLHVGKTEEDKKCRKKKKSWIELNKKSPEQIDDWVSLGVVHLPSSLPNPLHEHLGKVKVKVKMA